MHTPDAPQPARDAATATPGSSRLRRPLQRAQRFLLGDDVFISYARADATTYALGLANELTKRELSCFLDQWGTPPGDKLPEPLLLALRKSTMLVLLGTEKAAASEAVRHEVEEFIRTGRPIIPISFDGSLERAAWFPIVRGLSLARDSQAALDAGRPSAEVISRVVNAEGFTQRNKRLRRVFWGTAAVMGALVITGGAVLAYQIERTGAATARAAAAEDRQQRAEGEAAAAEMQRDSAVGLAAAAERQAQLALDAEAAARDSAEAQRRIARALNLANDATLALDATGAGLERSALLALESLDRAWTAEGVAALERAMMLLMRPPRESFGLPAGNDGQIRTLAVDPDGKWLAVSSLTRMSSPDGPAVRRESVTLRRRESGEEVFQVDVDEPVNVLALSPDGRWLAAGGNRRGHIWDVRARQPVVQLWSDAPAGPAAGDSAGAPPVQQEILRTRNSSRQGVLTFSPDGRRLAVVTGDHAVRLYAHESEGWREDSRLLHENARLRPVQRRVLTAAFSMDGLRLATGFQDGIALWDVASGARIGETVLPGGDAFLLAFSPNGQSLASVHPSGGLRIWNVSRQTGDQGIALTAAIDDIDFPGNVVMDQVAFSPVRQYLALRTAGGVVRLLALENVTTDLQWPDSVYHAAPNRATSRKQAHVIWRGNTQQRWKELNRLPEAARFLALTRSELVVATPREVRIWDEGHNTWETEWIRHPRAVRSWTFSPDGRWLVTVGVEGMLRAFDGYSLRSVTVPGTEGDSVLEAHFSPDGRWLAVGGARTLRVLRAGSWEQVADLPTFQAGAQESTGSRFTPDGRWLVGVWGAAIRVLRVGSRRASPLLVLQEQPDPDFHLQVDSVRVSPDGRWLAARETFAFRRPVRRADANLARAPQWRVWSLTTADQATATAPLSRDSAATARGAAELAATSTRWPAFDMQSRPYDRTGNDRWDATVDGGLVRLWPLRPRDIIESACRRLSRSLTPSEWQAYMAGETYRRTCAAIPDDPLGPSTAGGESSRSRR